MGASQNRETGERETARERARGSETSARGQRQDQWHCHRVILSWRRACIDVAYIHFSAEKTKKKKTLYTKIHSWSGPLSLVRCREMGTAAAPNNGSDSLEISRILNYILKIVKNTNPSNNTQNSTDYVGDS